MNFNPDAKRPNKVNFGSRVKPETREMFDQLAEAYGTTRAAILDAVAETYGPVLLRDAKK